MFKNNYVILDIQSKELINASKKKWITFINTEFQKKTGEYIVRFLMKSCETWDNYSLCVIYLSLIRSLFSEKDKQKHKDYRQILITNILSTPLERDNTSDTTTKINEYIQSL